MVFGFVFVLYFWACVVVGRVGVVVGIRGFVFIYLFVFCSYCGSLLSFSYFYFFRGYFFVRCFLESLEGA